jgi:intracellular sulfur oxidation DsrE/DsrF family protein
MFGHQEPIQRRHFLGTLLASASVGVAGLALPVSLGAAAERTPPAPGGSEFDSWLGKIKGKHKQVFDCPAPNMGMPFAWARVFLMTNKGVGVSEKDVTVVMVLRHNGIPLGMESRLWEKYKFGEMFKVDDPETKTPLTANPFWQPKEGSLPLPGMGIDELQKSGVLFGICDMALTVYSKMAGDKMKVDAAEVKKDWVSGILPGIQIVPSGVLAVNRAQEHGCTYCFAG